MGDRVRFKEFAQVRKANKTISWPAGEYDYVPEMAPIIADGRAVRVPSVEQKSAPPPHDAPMPSAQQARQRTHPVSKDD